MSACLFFYPLWLGLDICQESLMHFECTVLFLCVNMIPFSLVLSNSSCHDDYMIVYARNKYNNSFQCWEPIGSAGMHECCHGTTGMSNGKIDLINSAWFSPSADHGGEGGENKTKTSTLYGRFFVIIILTPLPWPPHSQAKKPTRLTGYPR